MGTERFFTFFVSSQQPTQSIRLLPHRWDLFCDYALKFDRIDQFLKVIDEHGRVISVSCRMGDIDAERHC